MENGSMRLDRGQIEVVDEEIARILRKKSPTERLRIGFDLWESAFLAITAQVQSMHPDWGEEKTRKEVARRMSHGAV